jgi:hypothetical protein
MTGVAEIIGAIADLVGAIDGLLQTDTFKELVNVVKDLGLESTVLPVLGVICDVLQRVIRWLGTLERIAAMPAVTEPLMFHIAHIRDMTNMTSPGKRADLEEMGWGGIIPAAEAANVAADMFTRLWRVANALTAGELLETKIGALGKSMSGLLATFDGSRKQLGAGAEAGETPRLEGALA